MRFSMATLLGLTLLGSAAACALPEDEGGAEADEAVTNIPTSAVETQDIANCWIYTGVAWAESLHAQATGEVLDLSEAWVTYWRWFDLVAHASLRDRVIKPDAVLEPGFFSYSAGLLARYGVVEESGFPSTTTAEALRRFNDALARGALQTRESRRDPLKVRRALDDAFGLLPATVSAMNALFGADGEGKPSDATSPESAAQLRFRSANTFGVRLPNPRTHAPEQRTLADAAGEGATGYGWQGAVSPWLTDDREWLRRIQRALHDGYPVPIIWYADQSANPNGIDFDMPAGGLRYGAGGWHVTLITDYSAENVPGFGALPAGRVETRPEALEAALDDRAVVSVLRVKNSWGVRGVTFDPLKVRGYADLHRDYYRSFIPRFPIRVARSVNLPAGY